MFTDKTLLITGGTGSFGNAVMRRFLSSAVREIRVFSRDEKKQDDMRKRYRNAKLKFYVGDVRDARSVAGAMRGVDYCFHAAALKQVPSCEFYPMQAVHTNVLGTENVLDTSRPKPAARRAPWPGPRWCSPSPAALCWRSSCSRPGSSGCCRRGSTAAPSAC